MCPLSYSYFVQTFFDLRPKIPKPDIVPAFTPGIYFQILPSGMTEIWILPVPLFSVLCICTLIKSWRHWKNAPATTVFRIGDVKKTTGQEDLTGLISKVLPLPRAIKSRRPHDVTHQNTATSTVIAMRHYRLIWHGDEQVYPNAHKTAQLEHINHDCVSLSPIWLHTW